MIPHVVGVCVCTDLGKISMLLRSKLLICYYNTTTIACQLVSYYYTNTSTIYHRASVLLLKSNGICLLLYSMPAVCLQSAVCLRLFRTVESDYAPLHFRAECGSLPPAPPDSGRTIHVVIFMNYCDCGTDLLRSTFDDTFFARVTLP